MPRADPSLAAVRVCAPHLDSHAPFTWDSFGYRAETWMAQRVKHPDAMAHVLHGFDCNSTVCFL